jgi:hypothetical protein
MPDVVCPSCGAVSQLDEVQRAADDFCRVCDYPLFWARSSKLTVGAPVDDNGESLRRLPGTAGLQDQPWIDCPNEECREPNLLKPLYCIRCGTALHPPPVVVIESTAPLASRPPVVLVQPPPVKSSYWPYSWSSTGPTVAP